MRIILCGIVITGNELPPQIPYMLPEYPEIIAELIEKAQSDELRHFDLCSFMSDKSLEDVFEEIPPVRLVDS